MDDILNEVLEWITQRKDFNRDLRKDITDHNCYAAGNIDGELEVLKDLESLLLS